MHPHALFLGLVLLGAVHPTTALAADPPDDAGALELADKAPAAKKPQASPWRAYGEAAVARGWLRQPTSRGNGYRGSLDMRYDGTIAPGLRAVLSDRLDLVQGDAFLDDNDINALREAYVSWQLLPEVTADLGRVNVRNGVAWGYNPTDYFRGGALRSIVSPDPAALRENRLGTVVVQVQKVWSDSSFSATFSPKLASTPSDATFSLDLGSTNARNRWLLTASRKLGGLNPQLLLHGGEDTPTQVGLNVSALLGSATVAFAEASIGKGRSLRAQVIAGTDSDRWQQRAALGLTHTTAFNLSLTVEAEFSSAAPSRAQWYELRTRSPTGALRLLQTAQTLQELPTRNAAFVYATWRDFMIRRVDLSGFVRYDVATRSREQWIETRYHWNDVDIALQWQLHSGRPDSVYGSVPQKRIVELSARLYF